MRAETTVLLVLPDAPSPAHLRRAEGWRTLLRQRGAAPVEVRAADGSEAAYTLAHQHLERAPAVLMLHVAGEHAWDEDAAARQLADLPTSGLHEWFDRPPMPAERSWERGSPGGWPGGWPGEPLPPTSPSGRPQFFDPSSYTPEPPSAPPGLPEVPGNDIPGWSLPGGSPNPEPPPPLDIVAPPVQIEGGTNDVHVLWPPGGGEITTVAAGPATASSQLFAITADSLTLSASTVVGYVRITPGANGAAEEWRWSPGKAWVTPFRVVPLSPARYEQLRAIVQTARGSATAAAWQAQWPDTVAFVWNGISSTATHASVKPARLWLAGFRRSDASKKGSTVKVLYLSLPTTAPAGSPAMPVWYLAGAPQPVVIATGQHLRVVTSAVPDTSVSLYAEAG